MRLAPFLAFAWCVEEFHGLGLLAFVEVAGLLGGGDPFTCTFGVSLI
jgi:hypothetical protein